MTIAAPARRLRKEKMILNTWSRNCKIFVKINQNGQLTTRVITEMKDFQKIEPNLKQCVALMLFNRGHGGRVVTLSPPTSEAGVLSPSRPQVGKLVVAHAAE